MHATSILARPGLLVGLTFLVAVGPVWAGDAPPARQRPNVVFLLSDDQRPDTIHALGNDRIRTPNLDRLVRQGTAFTRAVSPNPLCVPSRAEILTGCSGFRNGVLPPFSNRLDPDLVTWPEAMERAGYQTWYVGKWHTSGRPSTQGYDESQGLFSSGGPTRPVRHDFKGRAITGYTGWVFQTDDRRLFPERGVGLTADVNIRFADAAIDIIGRERKPSRPFFLHVNFTAPHDPLIAPPGFDLSRVRAADRVPLPANFLPEHPFDHGNLRGRDEALWSWPRTEDEVRDDLTLYYAIIEHLDVQVGRIIDALEETGQKENTIIVFASDHGLAIGSHGLRGKQNMYEHTVGVPLIIAGPGLGLPQNQRRRSTIYLRDLYPTVCDLAGVAIPETVEAHSRAGAVRGEDGDADDREDRFVFGYFMDVQRMLRGDRWKLIRYPKVAREQLFDLESDPDERHDLAAEPEHAALLAGLRRTLEDWQRRVGDPLVKP